MFREFNHRARAMQNVIESLDVKNFCGIKHAELNLSRFLVLIGPQSSGKSIISKLIYWSRMCISNIYYDVQEGGTYRSVLKNAKERFEESFVCDTNDEFLVVYRLGEFTITACLTKRKTISISFSSELSSVISNFVRATRDLQTEDISEEPRRARSSRREARKVFDALIAENSNNMTAPRWPIYVPAARSFFSQIEESLFVFLSSSKRLDPVVEGFGDFLFWAKDAISRRAKKDGNGDFLNVLYSKILRGRYVREQKTDYIDHPDGRRVPISSASSGQQEIFPLCILLSEMAREGATPRMCIIEEPEAHLHPSAQSVIIEAIVHAAVLGHGQAIITTHSPYVLSVINNLYLAGRIKSEQTKKYDVSNYAKRLTFGSTISPGDLSAYSLLDGRVTSLVDPETQLLRAETIDSVSGDLSADFDKLLETMY